MTAADGAVVVVGPTTVRGPCFAAEEHASVALACIDDRLALVDDRIVPVEHVWREVMRSTVGDATSVVVVVPSWWSRPRSSLVVGALPEACRDVVVLKRVDILRSDDACAVVEIAADLVAVHAGGTTTAVIPRTGDTANVAAAVIDRIVSSPVAVVDAPEEIDGARVLGEQIARSLRARGTSVSIADDGTVLRTVRTRPKRRRWRPGSRFVQPRAAVVAVSVASVVALTCAAVGSSAEAPEVAESVWVVEGRLAVEAPADWKVERVTTGPGSARLQIVSPSDPQVVLHLTQSVVPMQQSLAAAAEVLRNALATQPEGIFVDFTMAERRADRPAITYREVRPGHVVDWTVLLDDGVRIAIGCQREGGGGWPEGICERAIRSARVVT